MRTLAKYFQHLLSPLKVRGTVLKSRLMYPCAQPHYLGADERYPAEQITTFYTDRARNGMALLTVHDLANSFQRTMGGIDTPHFSMWDIHDPGCQNGFAHFAASVHYYGAKLCTSLAVDQEMPFTVTAEQGPPQMNNPADAGAPYKVMFGAIIGPEEYHKNNGETDLAGPGMDPNMAPKPFTDETVEVYIQAMIDKAKLYVGFGFDAIQLDLNRAAGQFFNPRINTRTDKWGRDRGLFARTLFSRLRAALGDEVIFTVNYPGAFAGLDFDETVELIRLIEPYADILHLRGGTEDGGNGVDCPARELSRQLKDAGVKMLIAVNTPYVSLERLDEVIASGDADIISSARLMICNERLGEILKNGQDDEVNPCIECNNCRGHARTWSGECISKCTINPELALSYRKEKMIAPVTAHKKVALIGGGPGAMKCALYLKERGHTPVIFEKSGELGGQIKTARYPDFKWRLARYLDYLIHMVEKRGIQVRLNTEATPEAIEREGFDAVVAATGAAPRLPNIPGIETADAVNIIDVYEKEAELGQNVAVIGGSSTGAEAAVFLAKRGHTVTELSRKNIIAYDDSPVRGRVYMNRLAYTSGVKVIPCALTVEVAPGSVTYRDEGGALHTIACDSLVAAGGMEPRRDEAIAFANAANEFYMIGDCKGDPGCNLMTAIADAYAVAMQI